MLAIVPVRRGMLPLGADEAVAEGGGPVVVIGSDSAIAAQRLSHLTDVLHNLELESFSPGLWARACADVVTSSPDLAGRHVILPASPDGRDLAPRLAAELGRLYLAGATRVGDRFAERPRYGGRIIDQVALTVPAVLTFQPGVRGIGPADVHEEPATAIELTPQGNRSRDNRAQSGDGHPDPTLLAELDADPSTMDLAEAGRIVGGGAGLGSAEAFERLAELATALGASAGGTRVVTDWGWLPVERQIGTTGVTVDPSLYLALGISGAVQHTAGLGSPDHLISVNTDPHCPMMSLADLAIVCDAPAFLDELLALISERA